MALTTRLELRQAQTLVMTPQLQQAIKLLQLSNLELSEFVDAELERNPLLERDEAGDARPEDGDGPAALEHGGSEAADAWIGEGKAAVDPAGDLDTDYSNVDPDASGADLASLPSSGWASVQGGARSFDEDGLDREDMATAELGLQDHLLSQLGVALTDPVERFIGLNLIDMVDEAGYLRGDLNELALRLGASPARIEATLGKLQRFDPAGVFARNLAECLALQLKELNRYDPQIARLLDNLPMLASHNIAGLKRLLGVDQAELNDMIGEIRRLNPKPGLKFGSSPCHTVVPDVNVRARKDGSWHVELNSETLPRVLVNQSYYTTVTRVARNPGDKSFLSDCLQTANWLVRTLDQRSRTILKVAEEIVRQQDQFLALGIEHMRPLNLKTVADAIGMHESTVSRVTSNKYMATNRGIFELKFFFTSAIAAAGAGEAHSSEAVRHRIRQMIDAESPDDILSDDRIVQKLEADGIEIARRTVAKYREALNIASSVQRRREKQLALQVAAVA